MANIILFILFLNMRIYGKYYFIYFVPKNAYLGQITSILFILFLNMRI